MKRLSLAMVGLASGLALSLGSVAGLSLDAAAAVAEEANPECQRECEYGEYCEDNPGEQTRCDELYGGGCKTIGAC